MGTAASSQMNAGVLRPPPGRVMGAPPEAQLPTTAPLGNATPPDRSTPAAGVDHTDMDNRVSDVGQGLQPLERDTNNNNNNSVDSGVAAADVIQDNGKRAREGGNVGDSSGLDEGPLRKRRARGAQEEGEEDGNGQDDVHAFGELTDGVGLSSAAATATVDSNVSTNATEIPVIPSVRPGVIHTAVGPHPPGEMGAAIAAVIQPANTVASPPVQAHAVPTGGGSDVTGNAAVVDVTASRADSLAGAAIDADAAAAHALAHAHVATGDPEATTVAAAAAVTAAANNVDNVFLSFQTTPTDQEISGPGGEVNTGHVLGSVVHSVPGAMGPGYVGVPMSTMAGNVPTIPTPAAVGIAPPQSTPPPPLSAHSSHILDAVGMTSATPSAMTVGAPASYSTMAAGMLSTSYNFLPMPSHGLLNPAPVTTADAAATTATVSAAAAAAAAANAAFVSRPFPPPTLSPALAMDPHVMGGEGGLSQAPLLSGIPGSDVVPSLSIVGPARRVSSVDRKRHNETGQDGDPPRRNRSRPTCTADGCQQRPLFGIEGTKQAVFCSHHKAPGMTNVLCRRCEVEGCRHQPSFAVEGSRAVRCATHKTAEMVNVAAPRCKSPGCMVCPSFGKQGERKASFCATHRQEGDVDLVTRRCHHEGCVHRPVFGHPPEKKAYYCASHKLEGMVNVFAPRCAFPECTHQPSYGLPGSKRSTHCGKHRTQFHENKR